MWCNGQSELTKSIQNIIFRVEKKMKLFQEFFLINWRKKVNGNSIRKQRDGIIISILLFIKYIWKYKSNIYYY